MSIAHRIRRLVQRTLAVDLARYPDNHPLFQVGKLLCSLDVSCVLDVGSHEGEYALDLRELGYDGRIVSFEPISQHLKALEERAGADSNWIVYPKAVGDRSGWTSINVAGNQGASSSLLEMLDSHVAAAPSSRYVDTEQIEVTRLDDAWTDLGIPSSDVFLKLDVQGHELAALEGARAAFERRSIVGVQTELSTVPLYRDGAYWKDVAEWLSSYNFVLVGVIPGFTDKGTGRMLQFDGIFANAQ